jgi:hypothetical protein
MTSHVEDRFKRVWDDFTVKDTDNYLTSLSVSTTTSSDTAKIIALSFFANYSGYDGTAYGEGEYNIGLTEQQAFDNWQEEYNRQEGLAKKQMMSNGVGSLPQCVYDAIILYHWATGKLFEVVSGNITYNLLTALQDSDHDTSADMISNSSINPQICVQLSSLLRLADYGKPKPRSWYRSNGIFKMRDYNQRGTMSNDQISRARYAYYAETLKFLPFTPEGRKRQLVKEYESTLIIQNFVFDGTNTVFTLEKAPSMSPSQKLEVLINENVQQTFYDFLVEGTTLTIKKSMNAGDIIKTTIKI